MKLTKINKTYHLELNGVVIRLYYVTSVVFYKLATFKHHAKWKAEQDVEIVSALFTKASSGCVDSAKALMFYETFYSELNGFKKAGFSAANAGRRCIMNNRTKTGVK